MEKIKYVLAALLVLLSANALDDGSFIQTFSRTDGSVFE